MMNRKKFLGSLVTMGAALKAIAQPKDDLQNPPAASLPPFLKPGDKIGITSPGGFITAEDLAPAVQKIQSWGYKSVIGETIGKRDFTFGGTDVERTADMQRMLDDSSLAGIMCARGGYGAVRILDRLDFTSFIKKPKWLIGFSDVTVFHSHINSSFNIASIHSKMCNSFPSDWTQADPIQIDTIESIHQALRGDKLSYSVAGNPFNRSGNAMAQLVGGNLRTLETLAGTPSDLITKDKILFVEDTGEYLYSIDRMFWNLKRSGKLSNIKGLIIGGFKTKKDDEGEEFGLSLEKIVSEKVKEFSYPVCFDFPVGHQRNNYALRSGSMHSLSVTAERSILETI